MPSSSCHEAVKRSQGPCLQHGYSGNARIGRLAYNLTTTGQTVTKRGAHDPSCQHIPDPTCTRDYLQSWHRTSQDGPDGVNVIWNRGGHGLRLSNVTIMAWLSTRAYLSSLSYDQLFAHVVNGIHQHPCCPPAAGFVGFDSQIIFVFIAPSRPSRGNQAVKAHTTKGAGPPPPHQGGETWSMVSDEIEGNTTVDQNLAS